MRTFDADLTQIIVSRRIQANIVTPPFFTGVSDSSAEPVGNVS
jgi:hypothetical protein